MCLPQIAWNTALAAGKGLPMNLFMMWMMGYLLAQQLLLSLDFISNIPAEARSIFG